MKKIFLTVAAFGITSGIPHVAHAMECCEEGKCACCKKEDGAAEPAPEGARQH